MKQLHLLTLFICIYCTSGCRRPPPDSVDCKFPFYYVFWTWYDACYFGECSVVEYPNFDRRDFRRCKINEMYTREISSCPSKYPYKSTCEINSDGMTSRSTCGYIPEVYIISTRCYSRNYRQCHSPFKLHGQMIYGCTKYNGDGRYWCSVRNVYLPKYPWIIWCAINGGWSSWSSWSTCDRTCISLDSLIVYKHRYRKCNNPKPEYHGKFCTGNGTDSVECDEVLKFCPIDGGWSEWTEYGTCSHTCHGFNFFSKRYRYRECSKPSPEYGGMDCQGENTEEKICTMDHCPIHGGWSHWEHWSGCSLSCLHDGQLSIMQRNRKCSHPVAEYNGKPCEGKSSIIEMCDVPKCKIDGNWNSWKAWTECSASCHFPNQVAVRKRRRECNNPLPQHNGNNCFNSDTQEEDCEELDWCSLDEQLYMREQMKSNACPGESMDKVLMKYVLPSFVCTFVLSLIIFGFRHFSKDYSKHILLGTTTKDYMDHEILKK